MLNRTSLITGTYDNPEGRSVAVFLASGGYAAAEKAVSMPREAVINEVKAAHIRGRGGAGFDCGMKWGFMPQLGPKPHYLVVNADEGEPGTFKDRTIMEQNPHLLIEGCIIGCYAIGAHTCYIYVRHELHLAKERLSAALEQARDKGYLGKHPFGKAYPVNIWIHTGAGAYICGEETALLNSLEGKRGEPRLKPPFPAQAGAFNCPTSVNNVETIAAVALALRIGGDSFSRMSSLHEFNDGGVRLFGVSGHVEAPGHLRSRGRIDAAGVDLRFGRRNLG